MFDIDKIDRNNIEPNLKQELIESFIEDNYYLDFIIKSLKELKHA